MLTRVKAYPPPTASAAVRVITISGLATERSIRLRTTSPPGGRAAGTRVQAFIHSLNAISSRSRSTSMLGVMVRGTTQTPAIASCLDTTSELPARKTQGTPGKWVLNRRMKAGPGRSGSSASISSTSTDPACSRYEVMASTPLPAVHTSNPSQASRSARSIRLCGSPRATSTPGRRGVTGSASRATAERSRMSTSRSTGSCTAVIDDSSTTAPGQLPGGSLADSGTSCLRARYWLFVHRVAEQERSGGDDPLARLHPTVGPDTDPVAEPAGDLQRGATELQF